MSKPFPKEFKRDVVAVARQRETPLRQIAKDLSASQRIRRGVADEPLNRRLAPSRGGTESVSLTHRSPAGIMQLAFIQVGNERISWLDRRLGKLG